MDIRVLEDPAAACAQLLTEAAEAGQQLALTGGSTPAAAYEQAAAIGADWSRAGVWWSDERCVPPDSDLSNFALVKRTLLDRLPAGRAPAVHRMKGEAGPEAGAESYERELQEILGGPIPRLDLLLLGLGPDAHVASLFPGQATLSVRARAVVGVEEAGHEPFVPRISLTLPVLCSAGRVVFLVTGAGKAEAVRRAFGGGPTDEAPGSLVRPSAGGELIVLLDEAAAAGLERQPS